MPLWGRKTADGRVLDRDGVAEPGLLVAGPCSGHSVASRSLFSSGVIAGDSAGRLPSKTIGEAGGRCWALREIVDVLQVLLPALVGEPDDLEQVVALGQTVGVVVDRLAGAGQTAGRRVFSSLKIRWASGSLHCKAMRTAIWPSVARASE